MSPSPLAPACSSPPSGSCRCNGATPMSRRRASPQVGHYLTNVLPFVNSCADSAHCGRGRFLFSQVWHLFPVTVLAVTGIALAARRRERVLLAMGSLGAPMALALRLQRV